MDREKKGRNVSTAHPERLQRGTARSNSKLSESKVTEIRMRYAKGGIYQKDLAREFSVDQALISRVVCHRKWKHVS